MLREINSEKFRHGAIRFGESLNVILGDENATNSIGKSTLLMVIDFAFGGRTLTEYNTDIVTELGHHSYHFTFEFDGETHIFQRGTEEPERVYECDDAYRVRRAMRLEEYTAFLKSSYEIALPDITFRSLVGLYMRVWGKENLAVERPLHAQQAQSSRECVDTLIKLFGRYGSIKELARTLAGLDAELTALRSAKRHAVVPSLTKSEYRRTQDRIESLERDIADIRLNLAQYATNISSVISRDVLDLKFQKDDLLQTRLEVANRLQRVQRNLHDNRSFRSRGFSELGAFFPSINQDRLAKVEDFHNGLAKVLREELRESAGELAKELERIDSNIVEIDAAMSKSLSSIEKPDAIVDHVYRVALELHTAKGASETFEREAQLDERISVARDELESEKQLVLGEIEVIINQGMRSIVNDVFGEGRKSPRINLQERGYSFEVYEDTGTGTAYAGLVVFDLTIFLNTQLPCVVHDSLLFKNIENDSVSALIHVYMATSKQSFIALDEISKYGDSTALLMRQRSVIQLDDENVLYVKDWRQRA